MIPVLLGCGGAACGGDGASRPASEPAVEGPLAVAVSILPQKYMVERIGGPAVSVSVLIGPGQSPLTYDPTPRQMASLAGTRMYFTMGLEFERAWLGRLRAVHRDMRVVDMRGGIRLMPLAGPGEPGDDAGQDPHVWMSPRLARVMAGVIRDALVEALPERRELFDLNYRRFVDHLGQLHGEIREILRDLPARTFMAFHPSWGYFAEEYGLRQIPIESHGREPGARSLSRLIDRAREERVRVLVVQAQFSRSTAETVGNAVGARVITLDPLAEDYANNLRLVAEALAEALRGGGAS
ncbi:MAG: zinc ABC transporter solute-binding protein [Gemmatimonadales bacterium]|nr:zinc ABC transporter solute-binding protein [Gemmatimonadales bacterium]